MVHRCVLTMTQVKTEDTLALRTPALDTVMVGHFVSLGMTGDGHMELLGNLMSVLRRQKERQTVLKTLNPG